MSLRPYLLLAGAALLFNLGLSLTGFYDWNFDSWAHLFFSSHYMNSWFDTWEPRWFGGFSVTAYPPLVTQLLALGAFAVGLENAYVILSLGVMILIPVAVFSFCSNFLSHQRALLAGFLTILLPSIYLTNYTWGQLPTLFALVTVLFAGTFLWRYLNQGRGRDALVALLLVGITAASHHFTFIAFFPVIVLVVSLTSIFSIRIEAKPILKRLVIFSLLSMPFAFLPIFPFWQFLLDTEIQTPIPHLSRANLFTDGLAFKQFLLAPYFLFLLALPLSLLAAYRHKYLIPLCCITIFLFILGLGGSTPLPKLIFGDWWQWLTYDRFALWTGILLLPLIASLAPPNLLEMGKRFTRPVIFIVLALVLLVMTAGPAYLATEPLRRTFLPSPPIVDQTVLVEFLDGSDVGQKYHYITLGFGEAQMQKLSTLTRAKSIDGSYYTARTAPVLRESGIATIDAIRYFDPELRVLDEILEMASSYNLKWVLVNDVFYNDILERQGFTPYLSADMTQDARFGNVTIWKKDDVTPVYNDSKSEKGFSSYVWGVGALLLVLTLMIMYLRGIKNTLKKSIRPFF